MAVALMFVFVFAEVALTVLFLWGLLKGGASNVLLGSILGVQFLVLAAVVTCYIRACIPPQEVAEERDEGLLW